MGFFHHESDEAKAYDEVTKHKSSATHQLIAAAAAYEAAKAWNKHKEENDGQPPSHAKAKELIAAVSAAFVDRMIETKGLDAIDAAKAKHDAKKRAEEALDTSGLYTQ